MGYKIKEYRQKIGMSQAQLARDSGVSRVTIWYLENNKAQTTTTQTLLKIAKAMNTTIDQIFFDESVQHLNIKQK